MKIVYRKSAAATAAFALITEGWNDLVQEGLTPDLLGCCPVDWRNEVLHAERDDGEIVGVLCFTRSEHTGAAVVTLGYVEPTSRRRGVFRGLVDALKARLRESEIAKLVFSLHRENIAGHEVMKRLGVGVATVIYETVLNA